MKYSSYEETLIGLIEMNHGLSDARNTVSSTSSNPTHLAILELLRSGIKNGSELSDELGQEQSMISHDLEPSIRCESVFVERKCNERLYALIEDAVKPRFGIIGRSTDNGCHEEECQTQLLGGEKC